MGLSTSLIVGVITAASALSAQAIAAWSSRRQAAAQERATRDRARYEVRRAANSNLLAEASAYRHACWYLVDGGYPSNRTEAAAQLAERWRDLCDRWTTLISAQAAVQLEDHAATAARTEKLMKYIRDLDGAAHAWRIDHTDQNYAAYRRVYSSDEFEELVVGYVAASQEGLRELL